MHAPMLLLYRRCFHLPVAAFIHERYRCLRAMPRYAQNARDNDEAAFQPRARVVCMRGGVARANN